jgi:type I restriction enzyme S subunit
MTDELPEIPESQEGWTVASVRSVVSTLQYGISTKADTDAKGGVAILRMGNIQNGRLDLSDLKYVPRSTDLVPVRLQRGDVLFNRTNSPDLVGKSAVVDVDDEMVFASYLIRLTARTDAIDPKYLCWWINSTWGRQWAARVKTDGVSQSNINGTKLGEMPIALAPLPEQHRIVEKVEALLEQVNRAKERLDRVPLILKRFRQAVLAAACSGELTREWRTDDSGTESPKGWRSYELQELAESTASAICAGPFGTIFKAHDFRDAGIPIIFLRHVAAGEYRTGKPGFMDTAKWNQLFRPYSVWGGELLVAKLGDPPGCCAIYPKGIGPAMVTPDVIKMTVNERLAVPEFLMHYLNSEPARQRAFGVAYGATRPRMNLDIFRGLEVPVPPLEEQKEIVTRVDRLFRLADTIERRVQAATARANKLPQAILSKAFSGELVPTEAELARLEGRTYETAEALLKRVTALGSDAPSAGKGRGRRARKAE